jgi:hypothetical protein
LTNKNSCFVKLPLNISNSKIATLLLDTGSDISLLKINSADDDAQVSIEKKIKIKGIGTEIVTSLGVCFGNFQLSNKVSIGHAIHIVDSNFPIPGDGILGKDFLEKHKGVINFAIPALQITIQDETFSFPMNQMFQETPVVNQSLLAETVPQITIPPRTEFTTKLGVNFSGPKLCLQKRVVDGLYIPNAIVKGESGYCRVRVINSLEIPSEIKITDFEFEDLDNYHAINFIESSHSKRLQSLESQILQNHLNKEEYDSILKICREFNDIFYLEDDQLTHTNATKHSISLLTQKPVFVKPYRIPEFQKPIVRQQIDQMLKDDIIENSVSPYNAPILIVPKKPDNMGNKRWRLVVDFRKLNDITESDAYPLPNITEILEQLGHSKYFSVIDLATGFHQILLSEDSKPFTAFTFEGRYQYKRLPMGLKNSPATFQRLMNHVLTGLQGIKCLVYLDDIVIYGSSLRDHNNKLIDVFNRLRQHNLKLQPSKCSFLRKEITYLGHVISEDGIKPDPDKIQAVRDYPTPKNKDNVRSFLGLASYYRKFIPNFSQIAYPMNNLLKNNIEFNWTSLCDESFDKLKAKLINPPILQYPHFNQEFILTADASQHAVGAVLSQGIIGKDLPIGYASRTLSKAEKNYSTIERELAAIVYGVQYFRPYLYGKKFKIVTDHKPLIYLFSISNPSSRLMKFRLKLEEYEFDIIHKPGKLNTNADALSRIYKLNGENSESYEQYLKHIKSKVIINSNVLESDEAMEDSSDDVNLVYFTDKHFESEVEYHNSRPELKTQNVNISDIAFLKSDNRYFLYLITKETHAHKSSYADIFQGLINLKEFSFKYSIGKIGISTSNLKLHKIKFESIRTMIRYIFKDTNIQIIIFHNNTKKDLTRNEIQDILKDYHVNPLGGHQGVNRTFNRIKEHYRWHKMYKDIKHFINSCQTCQQNKISRKTKAPMTITSTSSKPFEKIFLDVVGPLNPTENNNKFILTFIDDLTKFFIAIPIPNQEANTIAKNFTTEIICKFGMPQTVLTDQGTNFESAIFRKTCKLLKIKKIHGTSFHPQTNGSLERTHRTLAEYLRSFINRDRDNWDEFLPFAAFTYNTTPHTSTKITPFELLFGHKASIPTSLKENPEIHYNYDDYYAELKARLQHSHQIARETIIREKEKSKNRYDSNVNQQNFSPGDKVWLTNDAKAPGKSKKLEPRFKGPFTVLSKDSDVNYTILVNKKPTTVHVNRLKKFS